MKLIFIMWLSLGISVISYSQTVTIRDNETGSPIISATLISETPRVFAATNVNGQTNISAFKSAESIEIRAIGYKTEIKSYVELESLMFEFSLVPISMALNSVIISATRWSQESSDVPSKIISISPKEAALQNPQTSADLLAITGKVFIQKSQQGGGSPMIRGFATNRLLYTVDGVRMNTAIFRGGNIQSVISLDAFSIEHTEVFFGPGSVIYGSDAIGGVMSFQTLTPLLSLEDKPLLKGRGITRFSSANNEKTGHFDINVGWKKWAMVTSFSANDFGDLRMGSYGPDEYLRPVYVRRIDNVDVIETNDDPEVQRPSGYSQVNMMQKFRYMPNEKWDFQYGFHYSETSDYSRYDRHIQSENGMPLYGEWSYGPQKWMMNNFNITHSGTTKAFDQMGFRVAQQFFEESRWSRDINEHDRAVRIEEVDAYSANIDFVKTVGTKNKLFYGVEGIWNLVTSTGINEDIIAGTSVPGASRYPQSTWASYGLYITDQFKVTDKYMIQTGLRYNRFILDAKFDNTFYPFPFTTANLNNGALTGSVGFVYRPTDHWVVSANGATAFRSPNVDDLGKVFDSEPGSVVVPNPDLKAEYAYNVDFSIAKVFGDAVKVDLTSYYTILQNALVRRDYTLNGQDNILYDGTLSQVQAMQNAAVANVYGIQTGIEVKLPAGFRFSSDFNYQIGEEELDDGSISPARHAAPSFGTTRLLYKSQKLNIQLYVLYSGEKSFEELPDEEKGKDFMYATDKNGNPYSPSWYSLSIKATYQFVDQALISAGLENMTDQRYRPFGSGIVAPGRNFILSLQYKF